MASPLSVATSEDGHAWTFGRDSTSDGAPTGAPVVSTCWRCRPASSPHATAKPVAFHAATGQAPLAAICTAADAVTPPSPGTTIDIQRVSGTATPLVVQPPSVHTARKPSPEGDAASVGLEGSGSGVVIVTGAAATSLPPVHCAASLGGGRAAAASHDSASASAAPVSAAGGPGVSSRSVASVVPAAPTDVPAVRGRSEPSLELHAAASTPHAIVRRGHARRGRLPILVPASTMRAGANTPKSWPLSAPCCVMVGRVRRGPMVHKGYLRLSTAYQSEIPDRRLTSVARSLWLSDT